MSDLTYAQVSQLLKYEPETGKLFWKERSREMFAADHHWKWWNARFAGKEAFTSVDGQGYRQGRIFGHMYLAHRVAWLIHAGSWPTHQIDHINGDRTDNRIENLREVSNAENGRNQRRPADNTSGFTGVYWNKRGQKWLAEIRVDGRKKHLGFFDSIELAAAARAEANVKFGFHQNHGRFANGSL